MDAAIYSNWLNNLLVDVQSVCKYFQCYRVPVGEDGYSVSSDEPTSEEEPGDHLFSQDNGDNDIIEVIILLSKLSASSTVAFIRILFVSISSHYFVSWDLINKW